MDNAAPDAVSHAQRLGVPEAAGPMVLASQVWQLGSLLTAYITERIDVPDLQLGEAEVLMATRVREPSLITPGDLRVQLNLTSAGVTKRIDQVEAKGMIERRRHPQDRRSVTLHLTAAGTELADHTIEVVARAMAELAGGAIDTKAIGDLNDGLALLIDALTDAPQHGP